ncbi:MAG: CrcB family protein [Methanocalculaceae archaeon]|jgi:CrcB protein|nr:CrcB family protein [Methanocalculaceae archaeon]
MYTWLIIGIGGFIGAVLRYGVGGWIQGTTTTFPVGTLGVNTLGSFFLALIMYLSEYSGFFSDQTRIFLTIGVIGAFTTMSTFSYESFRMVEEGQYILFTANIILTIFLTIPAVIIGKISAGYLAGCL